MEGLSCLFQPFSAGSHHMKPSLNGRQKITHGTLIRLNYSSGTKRVTGVGLTLAKRVTHSYAGIKLLHKKKKLLATSLTSPLFLALISLFFGHTHVGHFSKLIALIPYNVFLVVLPLVIFLHTMPFMP